MTLKNASFLALIGMSLLTALLALDLINVVLGILRDVVPMQALLRSLIHEFASLSVTVFLFVFHRGQP